jgi:predicted O-methyltransferase YrrM
LADLPAGWGGGQHRARISATRRRLARTDPPRTRERPGDFRAVTVPERDCDLLRDLLVAEGAGTVVEIGLAYGSSALAIGEALVATGAPHPRHVVIDPLQTTVWSDAGWQLLVSAGLAPITRLVAEPSSAALPRLLAEGLTADAAFVDGSHRFHEVFLDLYFLRRIVRPGGLVVLDDHWWPSVRTAARYYETNLGWQVVPGAFAGGTVDPATGHPRAVAFRLPDPPVEPDFQAFQPF